MNELTTKQLLLKAIQKEFTDQFKLMNNIPDGVRAIIRFQNQYLNQDCGDYCLSYDTIEQAIAAIDEGYQRTVITVEVE